MREQPGTQGEIKHSILPAFLQGFCILGERVKGWKSERIQGWKGPGGQGPGIMGNLKKGGIYIRLSYWFPTMESNRCSYVLKEGFKAVNA